MWFDNRDLPGADWSLKLEISLELEIWSLEFL